MKTPARQLFCSICAFLSISFNAAGRIEGDGPGPGLSAALCEMASWQSPVKAVRDSLLMEKAAYLEEGGEHARAYETLCRISNFGLDETGQRTLICWKLVAAYDAGMMEEFQALLAEASATGLIDTGAMLPSGKPRRLSEDAAMLLSIIPGAGHLYAGDMAGAGKYFLLNGSIIALGTGAFLSGLYATAFLGGGLLLYTTLPRSTDLAVRRTGERNRSFLKDYYSPVYDELRQFPKNQGKQGPLSQLR